MKAIYKNKIESFISQPADIARYGIMKSWTEVNDLGIEWEEPRDVHRIFVKFANEKSMQSKDEVKLQYWQNHWPHQRVQKGVVAGAGRSGWMAQDDWFNGEWKDADSNIEVENDSLVYTFNPINAKEFPDEDFGAIYRRTLKIRLLFKDSRPEIQSIKVYTDSVWKEIEVKVEWGDEFAKENWQGKFEIYNGEFEHVEVLRNNVNVNEKGRFYCDGKPGSIKLRLRYAYNEDINSFDKTIVTLRNSARTFSFLIDDLLRGEKIFVKDFDVFVTKVSDDIDYAKFQKEWESEHPKTLYDRIKELPEQTFEKAWNDMPEKKNRGYMPLGCEGGRQKFGVHENGDVFCRKNWIPKVKGKDTDRLLWEGHEIRYSFGFPNVEPKERGIEEGYLPIIYTKWETDNVVYEQSAFVTLLGADSLGGERMQGDDSTILLAKVTLTNLSNENQKVRLKLEARGDSKEKLEEENGFVFATNYEPKRMRYFADIADKGVLKFEDDNLFYEINLMKKESHSIYFKIPFITLIEEKEHELAKNVDYEAEFSKVKKFWRNRISKGTQITTPNEMLNNFYRAHVTHMLISDDREVGSDRYASRVGTFHYGVFPNESCMCISDFSRRGYKKEAKERLELLVHHQSSVALLGNFTDIDGLYYGAGGYEQGPFGQHHGFVLWALGEHYWYSRDKEWLRRVAPSIIKGCDWIIQERKNTMKYAENGEKVLEYGFLPAGALEDVIDYYYWLSTNAYSYFGFNNVAKALADINHPEGERLVEEAKKYKEDMLKGFSESMSRSPVVKLRDGTYVPHIPARLYRRGRGFGWIRETLEGAIHLIRCGILEPWDERSTWIMKDYEDNLYISDRFGYSVDNFERDWFSLGGFSMQSNLLCHPIPYLLRDEPKQFLRGYFNAFVSTFYTDICALVEHALPTLAENNDVWFKPSDEAQSTFWLRLMLIYESYNELNLAMATPRTWLEKGQLIKIERAETQFGEMGYEIHSEVSNDKITMILEPPKRNPPHLIKIRFRHPEEKRIKKVIINGKIWNDFNVDKEIITIYKIKDKAEIVAYY